MNPHLYDSQVVCFPCFALCNFNPSFASVWPLFGPLISVSVPLYWFLRLRVHSALWYKGKKTHNSCSRSTFTKKVLPIKKGNDTLVQGPTFPNLGKTLRKPISSSASLCLESLFACAEPALCLYIVFVVCPRLLFCFFPSHFCQQRYKIWDKFLCLTPWEGRSCI